MDRDLAAREKAIADAWAAFVDKLPKRLPPGSDARLRAYEGFVAGWRAGFATHVCPNCNAPESVDLGTCSVCGCEEAEVG